MFALISWRVLVIIVGTVASVGSVIGFLGIAEVRSEEPAARRR